MFDTITVPSRRAETSRRTLLALAVTALAVLLAGLVFFDYILGVTVFWQAQLAAVAFAGLVILPVVLDGGRNAAALLFAVFIVSLMILSVAELTAVKPFMRFSHDVAPGISRAEVMSSLEQRFPDGGRFRRPVLGVGDGAPVIFPPPDMVTQADETLHFTLDPTDWRFDSEWFIVYLRDGRVVGEDYSGD